MPPAARGWPRRLALPALLLVYVAVRLWRAWGGGFMEFDEFWTYYVIGHPPREMVDEVLPHDAWFSLTYLVLKAVLNSFTGPAQLVAGRAVAILTGAVTVGAVAVWLQRRFGCTEALVFTALMCFSPTNLTYTVLVRPYVVMSACVLAGSIACWELLRGGRWWWHLVLAAAGTVLVYTQAWGGVLLVSIFGVTAFHYIGERRWQDLAALAGVGLLIGLAFIPHIPDFIWKLSVSERVRWDHIYGRLPVQDYVLGNLHWLYGGRAGSLVVGLLAVVAAWRWRPQSMRPVSFFLAVGLFAIAMGVAYSLAVSPVYNPRRQAVLFHGPIILGLAILIARMPKLMLALGISVLALNTGRILHSVPPSNVRPAHLAATRDLLPHLPEGAALYFDDEVPYDGYFELQERLGPKGRVRVLWVYEEAWKRRLAFEFLLRDLRESRPVLMVMHDDPESQTFLDSLADWGIRAEAGKVVVDGKTLLLARFQPP